MNKSQLRSQVRTRKSRLTPEICTVAANSFALQADAILASLLPEAEVLLYASLSDEVPTLAYLPLCPRRVLLPCVVSDTELELRRYTGSHDLVVSGKYRISEPVGEPCSQYDSLAVAFIPGMAFDAVGHRLGRGKGYYDRLLAHPAFRHVLKVGVCFDFQLFPSIPSEPHDVVMDRIIVVPTS